MVSEFAWWFCFPLELLAFLETRTKNKTGKTWAKESPTRNYRRDENRGCLLWVSNERSSAKSKEESNELLFIARTTKKKREENTAEDENEDEDKEEEEEVRLERKQSARISI